MIASPHTDWNDSFPISITGINMRIYLTKGGGAQKYLYVFTIDVKPGVGIADNTQVVLNLDLLHLNKNVWLLSGSPT